MIGLLKLSPGRTATLGDDGTWACEPPNEDIAGYLNERHDPQDGECGDHHRPWGWAAVARAAAALRVEYEVSGEPFGPLPDGVVS